MNLIWIVADTFRQDHGGAYGRLPEIWTPSLDSLAARSVRFDRHYTAAFPTMPTRADHALGTWTMSLMSWEPLPTGATTLAEMLTGSGFHTAAITDTPLYVRRNMNYDRGFQTFSAIAGQPGSLHLFKDKRHEALDQRAGWKYEADTNVAQTMTRAMEWLQLHHQEDFFLYVDTWDPHEPRDAPAYFTEQYLPDYDGEVVSPVYGHWWDMQGCSLEKVREAHATYCGEVTMVDTWMGVCSTS